MAVVGRVVGLSKSASLGQAAYLNSQGFTVLMCDNRNHGASSMNFSAIYMARSFTLGVETCVSWLRSDAGDPDAKMVAFGYSFSTFASVYSRTAANVPPIRPRLGRHIHDAQASEGIEAARRNFRGRDLTRHPYSIT